MTTVNNQIEPEVRKGVALSLDPANMNQFAEVLEKSGTGKRVLGAGQRALREMHSAMTELDDATRTVAGKTGRVTPRGPQGDVRMTREGLRAFSGHEGKLVDAAKVRFNNVGRAVQREVDVINNVIADSERLMSEALTDSTQPVLAGDIRRHVAGLEPTDRFRFLHERVDSGDKQTITAVLNGPAYLSGLDNDTRASITEAARRKFAPEAHATHATAVKAFEIVRRGIDTFVDDFNDKLKPLGPGESEVDGKIAAVKGGAS